MITLETLKSNEKVNTFIKQADASLIALGYTEHSFAHVTHVAETAAYILETLGYPAHEVELARIAAYLHDIGNLVNRVEHSQSGAVMAFRILDEMGMPPEDLEKCGKCSELIARFMDEKILAGLGLETHGSSGAEKKEPSMISAHERDQRIRNTYAMVDLIDQGVGKILEALRETGELDNTVILFLSDHGELMGDHGLWLKGPFFYDGLVNTPLIVRAPGRAAGETDVLASSIDVYPTCCELLGLPVPYRCDGVSQVSAYEGKAPRSSCLIEYRNGYMDNDDYTLVYLDEKYKFSQDQQGEYELTDRVNDPEENVNLLSGGANPELLAEYRAKLLDMLLHSASRFPEQYCHA